MRGAGHGPHRIEALVVTDSAVDDPKTRSRLRASSERGGDSGLRRLAAAMADAVEPGALENRRSLRDRAVNPRGEREGQNHWREASSISLASRRNASSTLAPVLADVLRALTFREPRTESISWSRTSIRSWRSDLFPKARTGIPPASRRALSIHGARSPSVLRRVMSKTARTPATPLRYASRNSSKNDRFPVMS